jgi:hypothetical protein
MDEAAYRQVLSTSIQLSCPFEKSILTRCAACSKAEKRNIAERELVSCMETEALERCIALRDALRQKFTFALGKSHIEGPLPHTQEMLMQCGGLRGLQFMVDGRDEVCDASLLVWQAQQKYGESANYPYSKIVQLAKSYYRPRQRW